MIHRREKVESNMICVPDVSMASRRERDVLSALRARRFAGAGWATQATTPGVCSITAAILSAESSQV